MLSHAPQREVEKLSSEHSQYWPSHSVPPSLSTCLQVSNQKHSLYLLPKMCPWEHGYSSTSSHQMHPETM